MRMLNRWNRSKPLIKVTNVYPVYERLIKCNQMTEKNACLLLLFRFILLWANSLLNCCMEVWNFFQTSTLIDFLGENFRKCWSHYSQITYGPDFINYVVYFSSEYQYLISLIETRMRLSLMETFLRSTAIFLFALHWFIGKRTSQDISDNTFFIVEILTSFPYTDCRAWTWWIQLQRYIILIKWD